MKCWWCGAEPEMVEVSRISDPHPSYIPGRWPWRARDHEHAIEIPSPAELVDGGHRVWSRIMAIAAE